MGISGSILARLTHWRPRWRGNWVYRLCLAAGVLLITLTAGFFLVPQIRAGAHTTFFVLQMLDSPVKPQSWFTKAPDRQEVLYHRPPGEGVADIYRIPDGKRRAAVLLFLGANAAGRDDPDVIRLGNALARSGFVVMFHWSPTMGLQQNIDPDEIENLVGAFQYLSAQEFVDPQRAGMGGFSVGGSFAMVAAADPRIRDDVAFLNSFGAYFDARDLFLQVASRSSHYQGQQESWAADRLTWLVFANELIETLDDPQERQIFADQFLRGQQGPPEENGARSIQAQAVRKLLEGTTLREAETLFDSLPVGFRAELESISPSGHLSNLRAPLLIMHDQGDPLIPVAESRRLAAALEGRSNFRYTETQVFDHVRPGSGGGWWLLAREGIKLYRHMYGIIRIAA